MNGFKEELRCINTVIQGTASDVTAKAIVTAIQKQKDPHTEVAKKLFGVDNPTDKQRRISKTINFGEIYGGIPHAF